MHVLKLHAVDALILDRSSVYSAAALNRVRHTILMHQTVHIKLYWSARPADLPLPELKLSVPYDYCRGFGN